MLSGFFGNYRVNLFIVLALIVLGFFDRIELIGAVTIILYWISIRGFEKFSSSSARLLCFASILLITFGLTLHLMPGFHSLIYLENYAVSPASMPHDEYWNFDKPFLMLCLFNYYMEGYHKRGSLRHSIYIGLALTIVCAVVLAGVGMVIGYAKLDIKWPEIIYSWTLLNLVAILAEEGFYRAFLQRFLTDYISSFKIKFAPILMLVFVSVLFGLSHYHLGYIHVILCSVAGLIFGYGIVKSKRVEACMLPHFLFNMLHMLLFTYPSAV
jgi:hypothetical protein